ARRLRRYDPAEEVRRDVPLPTVVGDDRHRLLVVARQQAFDPSLPRRPEGDPVTDPEFQHFRMRPHLVEEAEARDDAVVEVDELGLGQPVEINLHWIPLLRAGRRFPRSSIPRLTLPVTLPSKAFRYQLLRPHQIDRPDDLADIANLGLTFARPGPFSGIARPGAAR